MTLKNNFTQYEFPTITGGEMDDLYNRVSKAGVIDFELKKSKDGSIEFVNNPEFLVLYMGWLRKHNPKLNEWIISQSPCTSALEPGISEQEAADMGTRDYLNSPRKIKREMRKTKIKFNKWLNKNIKKDNQVEFFITDGRHTTELRDSE